MVVCPACARENPDDARFCNACGAALDVETRAPREERKVVTILFADLVGFTSRAEQLDPEDVRAILSDYHERVRRELERYGGTVEKFIGDAVMAAFGAPTAHEDDPERGVRAALAVREAIADLNEDDAARDLHVRVGITTGEVLVRLDARPEEGEGMAAGDVVNTAARLQAAAATDGILVDETTYRATERVIEYADSQEVEAKGKAEPISAHEALQARARFGIDVRQIGRTPLVGRERELDALAAALSRARSEREPQLVTLVGVPGIGKSRLVYELFRSIEAAPDLVTWRQGRSLPYGEGVSYWALAEMVKAQAGVLETDDEDQATAKLAETVRQIVDEERDAAWVERNLRPLIGLVAESELGADRRGEAFSAWRRFFEALAESRPLVLVFEDLHFADDGLLDFVDYLVDWASGVPLLVVGTARPELLARRPGWGGGKPSALTLSLSSLSDTETAQLVHVLLDRAVISAELQRQLVARAEGNPLYAEEFSRLVAEGRQPEELPETVQGIIGARLDSLTTEEKQHLQDAAVVGKVFWLGAVGRLSGSESWALEELLHGLERKEFVRRERRSSVAGETEYAFRHLLVRDVAYGQIPRTARADKHRLAAEWIEGIGRPEDHAEMLAHHYLSALELGRAAGTDVALVAGRAYPTLREAGDRAFALYAFPAAIRFYDEAIALAEAPDAELLFRRAEALHRSADSASERALEDARDALVAVGRDESAAEAEALLAESWWHRGDQDRCFAHLEQALALVGGEQATAGKARVLSQVARYRGIAGRTDGAIEAGQEALAIATRLGLDELQAEALDNMSLAKLDAGDLDGAIADLEQSIEVALAINSPEAARGYNNLSAAMTGVGDLRRGHRLRDESIRVSERLGAFLNGRFARSSLPWYLYWDGRWDEAVRLVDDVLTEAGREPWAGEAPARCPRALIRHCRGDDAGAVEDMRRVVELARRVRDPQALLPPLAGWFRLVSELGLEEEATVAGDELLRESARPHWLREWAIFEAFWVLRGSVWYEDFRTLLEPVLERPWAAAGWAILHEQYSEAAGLLFEIGHLAGEALARLRAAEQLVASGRRAEADEQLGKALAFYRSVGATRYIRQAEVLLAESA